MSADCFMPNVFSHLVKELEATVVTLMVGHYGLQHYRIVIGAVGEFVGLPLSGEVSAAALRTLPIHECGGGINFLDNGIGGHSYRVVI